MKVNEYLEAVLRDQTLPANGEELKALREHRKKVEALLRCEFEGSRPTIRYGGSMAKGTMIKAAYDLDLPCYFAHEDEGAGKTLKAIYDNVKSVLDKDYSTEPKTSAIRLRAATDRSDFTSTWCLADLLRLRMGTFSCIKLGPRRSDSRRTSKRTLSISETAVWLKPFA